MIEFDVNHVTKAIFSMAILGRFFFTSERNFKDRINPTKQMPTVSTKDKNNFVYETACSNSEAVYFVESQRFFKISIENCDC